MALRLGPPLLHSFHGFVPKTSPIRFSKVYAQNSMLPSVESHKPIMEVKEKLKRDHPSLHVGKNGRDDDEMILWFLKDRKFSVDEAVKKLTIAIKWHEEFGVSELSEESVKSIAETGKAYVHDFLDVYDRPVLIVVASKHFPAMQDPVEDEKLCVFLIEKALSKLPDGKEQILGIFDLREFGSENADIKFLKFLLSRCRLDVQVALPGLVPWFPRRQHPGGVALNSPLTTLVCLGAMTTMIIVSVALLLWIALLKYFQ